MQEWQQDVLMQFISLTSAENDVATNVLEASDWDLDHALELFYTSQTNEESDAEMARRLQNEGDRPRGAAAGAGAAAGEDAGGTDVRAPMPTKRERLIGGADDYPGAMYHRGHVDPRPIHGGLMDPFANFQAPRRAARAAYNDGGEDEPPRGGDAMDDDDDDPAPGPVGLAGMFQAPREILSRGSFEQVKGAATNQGKWLLVHVHDPSEFASHRLVRDVWGHETVKEIIKGSFVFWMTQSQTEEGRRFMAFYRVLPELCPHILLIDPVTGQKMKTWQGYIDPERFMEEIMDFCSHGPLDNGAHELGRQAAKRHNKGPSGGAGAGPSTVQVDASEDEIVVDGDEDEEFQRALALSMEGREGAGQPGGAGPSTAAGPARAAAGPSGSAAPVAPVAPAAPPAREVMAAALARLPAEPPAGAAGACKVVVKMPNGARVIRSFAADAPLAALADLVTSEVEEVAAGRAFTLKQPVPGAPALDLAEGTTMGAANVGGSILVVTLQ